jgi:hypothetical protein
VPTTTQPHDAQSLNAINNMHSVTEIVKGCERNRSLIWDPMYRDLRQDLRTCTGTQRWRFM